MIKASELKSFAREAAAIVARDKDVAAFEIYCASGDNRIARLNYTSDIPCRGVEELKSHSADGFQIRIVMKRDEHEVGTAYDAGDFGADAIRAVLARALQTTIVDPHFSGFPAEPRKLAANEAGEERPCTRLRCKPCRCCVVDTERSDWRVRAKRSRDAATSCTGARWRCERVSRSYRTNQFKLRRYPHR